LLSLGTIILWIILLHGIDCTKALLQDYADLCCCLVIAPFPIAKMVLQNITGVLSCNNWTLEQWEDESFIKATCGDLQPNNDIAGIGVSLRMFNSILKAVIFTTLI
jgi:hypothetical protein